MMWLAASMLAAGVMGVAWTLGSGPAGLFYLAAYVAATMPGWPLGWWLFGRKHAAGWIAGALIGYALTAWTIWLAIAVDERTPASHVVAWVLLMAATWAAGWPWRAGTRTPIVTLPAWQRRDTIGLLLLLWLVPLIVAPPFAHVGARDAAGNRQYRAYFTADVLWHAALVAELANRWLPPDNPFAADLKLHYYWTYFLVPADISTLSPREFGQDYIPWLLINATGNGVLFIGMVAVFAWSIVPRRAAAFAAAALVTVAASPEGLYVVLTDWWNGIPFAYVREHNIDAVTRGLLDGLTIDGLPRSLWYTPQHAAGCAFGLIALTIAAAAGATRKPLRPALASAFAAGVALAAAVTFSPLLGGMFALIYGLSLVVRDLVFREPGDDTGVRPLLRLVLVQAAAVVPVLLAVAACLSWNMVEGAGDLLVFGMYGFARHSPIATLMLSIGPIFLTALAGLWPVRRMPAALMPVVVGLVIGILLFYFVSMPDSDPVWIGWRAGQIIQVCLPPLIARAFVTLAAWTQARPGARRRLLLPATVTLLFLIGLPTTLIDEYNAQDVTNHLMGPGFKWTVTLSPDQQEAMAWIRRTTSPHAIVQMEPMIRGRETWTLIPTFAQRRMMGGQPISLLATPEYDKRAKRAQAIFNMRNAEEAWNASRQNHIDYFYLDQVERAEFGPESLAKFDNSPDFFRPVFRNREVSIYAVLH
jgi:hypothetical protein